MPSRAAPGIAEVEYRRREWAVEEFDGDEVEDSTVRAHSQNTSGLEAAINAKRHVSKFIPL